MNGFSRVMPRSLLLVVVLFVGHAALAADNEQVIFKQVRTQYIAALGDPQASSGSGAESWGLWRRDPGPRGVWLKNFDEQLEASGGVAPAGWTFDSSDWWLDENGLIMEQPVFSLPAGKYIVTGDREAMAMLIVHPADANGEMRWQLGNGVKLHDVTHLPCRSARYTQAANGASCSPALARRSDGRRKNVGWAGTAYRGRSSLWAVR